MLRRVFTLIALTLAAGCGGSSSMVGSPLRLHVEISAGANTPSGLEWSSILLVTGEDPQAPMDIEMGIQDGHGATDIEWTKAGTVSGIAFAGRRDGTAISQSVAARTLPDTGGTLSFTLGDDLFTGADAPAQVPANGDGPSLVVDKRLVRASANGGDVVRISNVGHRPTDTLVVGVLNGDRFTTSGCVGEMLQPSEHCDLTVTLAPGADQATVLGIAYVDDGVGHMTATALASH